MFRPRILIKFNNLAVGNIQPWWGWIAKLYMGVGASGRGGAKKRAWKIVGAELLSNLRWGRRLAFFCVAAVAETWANVGESEREKADEDGQEEEEGENK